MIKPLILTGFMGAGKSEIGPEAADRLGVPYFDTDCWMEEKLGIDVPSLVKTDLAAFRRIEAEALCTLVNQEASVISTGGGIISTTIGRAALKTANASIVWLQVPFEISKSRVSNDSGRQRPLFDDLVAAQSLFNERQRWYQQTADYSVDASRPKPQVVAAVLSVYA